MSEPHELEERAGLIVCITDGCSDPDEYPCKNCDNPQYAGCKVIARAVLNLVRQEQEKDMEDTICLPGVRWWWLSHTAKETSNG